MDTFPIVTLITYITYLAFNLFGIKIEYKKTIFTREEVRHIIKESGEEQAYWQTVNTSYCTGYLK